jgi:CubicO group peptidase (beta-lactamase class C family)
LNHTSGLREFLNLYAMAGADTRALTREDVLRAVKRQPALQNSPGAEFNYNNTAFSLAAQIVEQTSGQDFDDYVRDQIFRPLGMNDSYVRMTPQTIIRGCSD